MTLYGCQRTLADFVYCYDVFTIKDQKWQIVRWIRFCPHTGLPGHSGQFLLLMRRSLYISCLIFYIVA